jgi:hypothetical protein
MNKHYRSTDYLMKVRMHWLTGRMPDLLFPTGA